MPALLVNDQRINTHRVFFASNVTFNCALVLILATWITSWVWELEIPSIAWIAAWTVAGVAFMISMFSVAWLNGYQAAVDWELNEEPEARTRRQEFYEDSPDLYICQTTKSRRQYEAARKRLIDRRNARYATREGGERPPEMRFDDPRSLAELDARDREIQQLPEELRQMYTKRETINDDITPTIPTASSRSYNVAGVVLVLIMAAITIGVFL